MKRLGSSDSIGALMSICPTTEEHSPGTIHNHNHVYGRDFQSMLLDGLDEEGCVEDQSGGHVFEKKRRLSVDQVKALEKNFEMENKLEPERKVKLAQELGLQPRQVAVWFQNRRARWKTKQLERDYGVLKSNYDSLKVNYDSLRQDNETLLKEIRELKSKLYGVKEENNNVFVKEEAKPKSPINSGAKSEEEDAEEEDDEELHFGKTPINGGSDVDDEMVGPILFYPDLKDGSSDSDSSAILNDENHSNSPIQSSHHQFMPPTTASIGLNTFGFSVSGSGEGGDDGKPAASAEAYQPPFVKIEEHNFFSGDESCNFFSDEQAPTLHHWYCQEQWN